ncbi:hypothetical protein DFH07DRAFT_966243 [Mycena maculata]|uniref:Uncharacterized protein n=1 Tax=Mycena maculata TaxID=230809 RepID=A0AAD7IBH6_9AGAR|nr:hypothetical protein DFH07DRAFT_966243 [Mycena maculata]
MAHALLEAYEAITPILEDLPHPSASDSPRTIEAWEKLGILFLGAGLEIHSKHPDFMAIFDAQEAPEDDQEDPEEHENSQEDEPAHVDDEEEEQGNTTAAKKAKAREVVIRRAQRILGQGLNPPLDPEVTLDLITALPLEVAEKAEDSALTRVARGFKTVDDWERLLRKATRQGSRTDATFCQKSMALDAEPDLLQRDIHLRRSQSVTRTESYLHGLIHKMDTIKFTVEWKKRTGKNSGTYKRDFNVALFQRENEAIFRSLSADEKRDKMTEYAPQFTLFKRDRENIVTSRNRLQFAYKHFGSGVLIDPFFSASNLGQKRAKKFQSLLDVLRTLAPASDDETIPERTRFHDLEQENRHVLYDLTSALCADDNERELIAKFLDDFFIQYPTNIRPFQNLGAPLYPITSHSLYLFRSYTIARD